VILSKKNEFVILTNIMYLSTLSLMSTEIHNKSTYEPVTPPSKRARIEVNKEQTISPSNPVDLKLNIVEPGRDKRQPKPGVIETKEYVDKLQQEYYLVVRHLQAVEQLLKKSLDENRKKLYSMCDCYMVPDDSCCGPHDHTPMKCIHCGYELY
jgi:hypothetical protein